MSDGITKRVLGHRPTRSNPTGPGRIVRRLLGRNEAGLNLSDSNEDDNWDAPPPVTLADGSTVQLMKDGQSLKKAYDAIAAAKHRVCMEFYIWDDDATGRAFADLLVKKAGEGIRVYVLYDSFGVWAGNDRQMFARMKSAGINVAEFHPIRPWETRFGWRPYNRDHRKVVVVDDTFAGVGGLNIADAYAGTWVVDNDLTPLQLWRDTAIGVTGPATRHFLQAFAHTWNYTHHGGRIVRAMYEGGLHIPGSPKGSRVGKARDRSAISESIVEENTLALLGTVPTLASPLRPMLNTLIRNSTKSLRMTMAYFAPDDFLIKELCEAAARGVKVQLMFGAKSDLHLMVIAARAFYTTLLNAGVEIFERQHVVLHAKTLVVDDSISVIGSTNLDYRSIEFNLEVSAIVRNKQFGQHLNALFDHDVTYATKIEPDQWRQRPLRDRIGQWAVSRLRYLL